MLVIGVSLLAGVLGSAATRALVHRLAAGGRAQDPYVSWSLGLAGLVPAWLIAFVGLLGTTPGVRPQLAAAVPWILSAASALLGAIVSEARVRAAPAGRPWARGWREGVLALAPAWAIALAGLALKLWIRA